MDVEAYRAQVDKVKAKEVNLKEVITMVKPMDKDNFQEFIIFQQITDLLFFFLIRPHHEHIDILLRFYKSPLKIKYREKFCNNLLCILILQGDEHNYISLFRNFFHRDTFWFFLNQLDFLILRIHVRNCILILSCIGFFRILGKFWF